jgi:hypothetical protein
MDDHIVGLLKRHLAHQRAALTEFTMSGGAKDHGAYAAAVAKHNAYMEIEEEIKELEKRFLDD